MRVSEFSYELPDELIAQHPARTRRGSRLLALDAATDTVSDLKFPALLTLLRAGDVLVLNDTRVVAARLDARKSTGGRVEVLLERRLDERRLLVQIRASKASKVGTELEFGAGMRAVVAARRDAFFEIALGSGTDAAGLLRAFGKVPLPPYIRRPAEAGDAERYQTVYARRDGAVAAPTAGLHFDARMLEACRARGIEKLWVTLHVGAGTFQPVRTEIVEQHAMHAEHVEVPARTCTRIRAARARGARVVAVGTTTVRSLETAVVDGLPRPYSGDTRLFVYPGYRFRCVDALLTNFHLPRSTLLMLVCAFAGTERVLGAYRHAVRARYRFFSYGDAMFVTGVRA